MIFAPAGGEKLDALGCCVNAVNVMLLPLVWAWSSTPEELAAQYVTGDASFCPLRWMQVDPRRSKVSEDVLAE